MAITRSGINPLFSAIVIFMLASCGGNQGESNDPVGSKALPTKLHEISIANKIATYPGDRNDYKLTKSENGYTIEAVTNSTGVKILENVSSVQFANVSVNLEMEKKVNTLSPQDLTSLIELYIAFFNRLPDADGLSYWIDRINAGQTLSDVAESFYAAGVQYTSVTGYSTTMTNDDFIKVIYKNVLDRSGPTGPSGADVQYWSNQLISGRATRGTLVRIMLNSAHSYKGDPGWGWVPALLDNKSAVGNYFAIQHGLSYNSPEASIRETMAIAAAVRPTDTDAAIGMIDSLIKPKPIAATTTVPVVTTTPVVPATTPSVTPTTPLVVPTTPVAIPPTPVTPAVVPATPVAVPTVPAVTSTTPSVTPTKPVVTVVAVPLCGIVASSTARLQTPMVMSTLNDEQFARLFFSEMNLSSPQFSDVRAKLDKCNFPAALDAWKTAFIKMITTSSFLKSATGVILKAPGDVTALMANPIAYPAAGVPPDEQLINAVFANHRSDIPHTSFSDAQLIGRWGQFARRFANDPKSGAYWQRSPATLRDQIRSFFYTFINSIALSPDSFSAAIDARVTAEIAYYSLKWPIQNLHNARFINAPFPMNQRANALNTLQIALPYFPDFLDADAYRKSLDQDLPLLFGGAYYSPIGTDISADGFGSELSYNYVYGVTTYALQDILNIAGTQSPQPAWLPEATKQKAKFEELKRHLGTPGGVLILGKNGRGETRMNVYSPANPPPAPGFLSEHFPYHGLSIMRQNWTRQSLFLALANPRRGSGHEAEDANKVHVEAYGQYMLVSNSGGDSIDLYFGSSWGQKYSQRK